jgi:hypothetical protein
LAELATGGTRFHAELIPGNPGDYAVSLYRYDPKEKKHERVVQSKGDTLTDAAQKGLVDLNPKLEEWRRETEAR